jgi:MoaA/NifB/PqqE/SkfB family radical SAM enzyme
MGGIPVGEPSPVSQVQILLTERCNIRCKHCAVPAEDSPADHEMSTGEWTTFLDAAAATGVESIVVNGGEALIRSDAVDLIEHALGAGIRWATLITNGLLFGARAAARIAEVQRAFPAFGVHVSVDGATARTHDWMRGAGTFGRMLTGIRRLQDHGGRINGVNSVIHRGNVHEFEDLARLVASWRAEFWTVFPSADLGRGAALGDTRLSREVWLDLYARARAVRDEYALHVGIGGPVMADEWPEHDSQVPRPLVARPDKACVGPDGSVFTCPPLRRNEIGSVNDGCSSERWLAIARRAAESLDRTCASCKYLLVCTNVDLKDPLRPRPGPFGPPGSHSSPPEPAQSADPPSGPRSPRPVPLILSRKPSSQAPPAS